VIEISYQRNILACGQVVQVRRGRDAGSWAVVIAVDDAGFIWLADGRHHKAEHPKKKNCKHVQPTRYIATDIQVACRNNKKVSNAQLRYALKQFLLRFQECKGE
jgi:ribosomal protein L14E/L6E/L27E